MAVIQINWNPSSRELRRFAAIWLAGFAALGTLVAWRTGAFAVPLAWARPWLAPLLLWVGAVVVGAIGLASPASVRPVYVGWMAVGFPIGWTMSHLLLAVTYFGVLTPVALFFRLVGRDALCRRFDRAASSYWTARPLPPDVDRYFKQF